MNSNKSGRSARLDLYLLAAVVLAAFLNGFRIWTEHYANTYYTMAVGSMLQSFYNFFFASLDSAGSVTVDKPPLTFWIQAASAYLFGLHGWSVILPQALAGVGSVLLLYTLVVPNFGRVAGRIAALTMAATPVAVAVARTNNIDAMLVFTLLLGAWALFKAVRNGRLLPAVCAFALVGAGFNMKMLQAFMVLPAFYLFYLIAAKTDWRRKLGILAASTIALVAVSLSWAVVVDSIPADKRPYIGSSTTNSVLELAFGYNGVSRLTGERSPGGGQGPAGVPDDGRSRGDGGNGGGPGQRPGQAPGGGAPNGLRSDGGQGQPPAAPPNGAGRTDGGGFNPGGGGGMFNTGQKGPLRLLQSELSGQASWLLPFVAIALLGLLAGVRRGSLTQQHKETLFWLAWLVPGVVFFSIAGFFHQYYLIMLAPPVAALVGAGWTVLLRHYRERTDWRAWLLPAAVLPTAVLAWWIIRPYDDVIGSAWSMGVLGAGIVLTLLLAIAGRMDVRAMRIAAVGALVLMFVGPLYWATTPITYGQNNMLPAAGPTASGGPGARGAGRGGMSFPVGGPGQGPDQENAVLNEKALAYLQTHNTGETYLFAAADYNTAAPYIIDAGEKVISLSGFNGGDPVYTVAELEKLVADGKVKYFMLSGRGFGGIGGPGGRGGSAELSAWIEAHGTEVPASDWQGAATGGFGGFGDQGGNAVLYEVKR